MLVFSTSIGPDADPITKDDALWAALLPHDRFSAAHHFQSEVETKSKFTYGDYFSAVHAFLTENGYRNLTDALTRILQQNICAEAIGSVNLQLLKHGRYYHPARVTVKLEGQTLFLVLNAAVSTAGCNIIQGEFDSLKRLEAEFPISFLPRAYVFGEVAGPENSPIKMFLGEWLDGYHEFHLSLNSTPNATCKQPQITVWSEKGEILNPEQTLDLIQKASMILTFYYNPETFEQIFPWHHAAGDFVVRINTERMDLKLITVRGYAPLTSEEITSNPDHSPVEKILETLLLFLVQLSLRMRMDRLDGIGEIAFHSEECIPAIVKGFFQGLDLTATMRGYPDDFCAAVKLYLNTLTREEYFQYATACAARCITSPNDTAATEIDLVQHVHILTQALKAHAAT